MIEMFSPRFRAMLPILCLLAGCTGTPAGQPDSTDAPADRGGLALRRDDAARSASEAQVIAAVDDEKSIFFTTGQAVVDDVGKQKLQRQAARLKDNPRQVVMLVGYTDDRGSSSYNLAIVEQRVDAVFRLLRGYGVPARQLQRYGVGGEKNSNACLSALCQAKMRRVALVDRE